MKLNFKQAYVWLLLFFCSQVCAQNHTSIIDITSKQASYVIGNKVTYLEDTGNRLQLEDVMQLSNKFIPSKSQKLNLGFSSSTYWIKFHIKKDKEVEQNSWLINLDYPMLDYVTFYYRNKAGEWQKTLSGDNYSIHVRKPQTRTFAFPLTYLPAEQTQTYYLQIKTQGSFQVPLLLQSSENFYQSEVIIEMYYGVFVGILLLLIINNIFWGIAFKRPCIFGTYCMS